MSLEPPFSWRERAFPLYPANPRRRWTVLGFRYFVLGLGLTISRGSIRLRLGRREWWWTKLRQ